MSEMDEDNDALAAAREADAKVQAALEENKNLLLEAGAGAGKTYSLIGALRYLIDKKGDGLARKGQRIACITYTNAATEVISKRIDANPLVLTGTIHAFCWSLIHTFQPALRKQLSAMEKWREKILEAGGLNNQLIRYDLGHRRIDDKVVTLHHDDVLELTVALLAFEKFKALLATRYPYVLIDEYQDTNSAVLDAFKQHLFGREDGPLFALFGDHWQRIYEDTCGRVQHPTLIEIGKKANFRSAVSIVDVLNRVRVTLPQGVKDKELIGSAKVFHTNTWKGLRRDGKGGGHWKGDLPAEAANSYFEGLLKKLERDGWELSAEKTKILMLTHSVLAGRQGYASIAGLFKFTDDYVKKADPYIAFFVDTVEPACRAFGDRAYGQMFKILGAETPKVTSQASKGVWSKFMKELIATRDTGSIGQVLDLLAASGKIALPEALEEREEQARKPEALDGQDAERVVRARQLRGISYKEVIALDRFINGHTPFATKHSVKGDEFENVLVVVGRGWNHYNFGQFLEYDAKPDSIPIDRRDFYERNRNLFYVACSRPRVRLALLFTQELSPAAMSHLEKWFGKQNVQAFAPDA